MPYINIKITREGATPEQKAELIGGVTDLMVRVLDKSPATTFVVIDEVEMEDWGIGGLPVEHLDPAIVMPADQMVDAALVGFQRGELVTIPSLHEEDAWTRFETARQGLASKLSANVPAARYTAAH